MITSSELTEVKNIVGKCKVSGITTKDDMFITYKCIDYLLKEIDDLKKEVKKLKNK